MRLFHSLSEKTLRRIRGNSEPYYDLNDDWSLVVSSFQTQYGIRLSESLKEMSFREFAYLIEGLSDTTPLGRIVAIRAENNPEHLKEFTPEQRKIRSEYRRKAASKKTKKEVGDAIEQFKQAFISLAKT